MIRRIKHIVLIVALSLTLAACGEEELYQGLSPRDANEMVALLLRNNIDVSRVQGEANTFKLMVPREQFAEATEILSSNGYPRESYRSLADIFPGEGLIVSPFEQRARLAYALNQEMARTISTIDGVVSSRVHVVVPELDMRGQPQGKSSAAVVVHHRPNVDPGELAPKIRLIISNGVQGLNYKDVSIAFFATRESRGPMSMSASPSMAPAASKGTSAQSQENQPSGNQSENLQLRSTEKEESQPTIIQGKAPPEPKIFGYSLNTVLWTAAGMSALAAFILFLIRRRSAQS
jgi:type III secretion protein J